MNQRSHDLKPRTPPDKLLQLQRRFADHIRNPEESAPPPGIEERRLVIYRRLFFNNLSNLMAKNFPVLRRLYSDEAWDGLIRAFLRDHRAETPLFPQIGEEMVRFLAGLQTGPLLPYPFLYELAHWEYLETCVRFDEADPISIDPTPDAVPGETRPILNPTLRLAAYQWPVHRIGPKYLPKAPGQGQIILLACRQRDDKVAFKEINLLAAQLIELIQLHPAFTGHELMSQLSARLPHIDVGALTTQGLKLLGSLRESEVILAFAD